MKVVLTSVFTSAQRKVIDDQSIFLTPEHFLLFFLKDHDLRLLLAKLNVDPGTLEELIKEYLGSLPRQKVRVDTFTFSFAFISIFYRLTSKNSRDGHIEGKHFLEAYAYEGVSNRDERLLPIISSLLGRHHGEIELEVYGTLPKG